MVITLTNNISTRDEGTHEEQYVQYFIYTI